MIRRLRAQLPDPDTLFWFLFCWLFFWGFGIAVLGGVLALLGWQINAIWVALLIPVVHFAYGRPVFRRLRRQE